MSTLTGVMGGRRASRLCEGWFREGAWFACLLLVIGRSEFWRYIKLRALGSRVVASAPSVFIGRAGVISVENQTHSWLEKVCLWF